MLYKKILSIFTFSVFLFLLFCTFTSTQVERLLLPQVVTCVPVEGIVTVNGEEQTFTYTIPASALTKEEKTYYAYCLFETNDHFGKKQLAIRYPVTVIAIDGHLAALEKKGLYEFILQSSLPLEEEKEVMITPKIQEDYHYE